MVSTWHPPAGSATAPATIKRPRPGELRVQGLVPGVTGDPAPRARALGTSIDPDRRGVLGSVPLSAAAASSYRLAERQAVRLGSDDQTPKGSGTKVPDTRRPKQWEGVRRGTASTHQPTAGKFTDKRRREGTNSAEGAPTGRSADAADETSTEGTARPPRHRGRSTSAAEHGGDRGKRQPRQSTSKAGRGERQPRPSSSKAGELGPNDYGS